MLLSPYFFRHPSPVLSAPTRYLLSDFHALGQRYDVHYSLPEGDGGEDDPCLMQGHISEHRLAPGFSLVNSDVQAFHTYRADSLDMPDLTLALVLQGQASITYTRTQPLQPGACITALCGDGRPMSALHRGGAHLRGLNLSLRRPQDVGDEALAELIEARLRGHGSALSCWALPAHLLAGIEDMLSGRWQGTLQHLLCQGLSLQLLSHGLASFDSLPAPSSGLCPRDRLMLERVREHLHQQPGDEHDLTELARLACMSSSSLRSKFRALYGETVFGYLRNRRLDQARQLLEQGWQIQQAAHHVGYRHASNFATAFRQRFGHAPRETA